jgi:hypothetical protein
MTDREEIKQSLHLEIDRQQNILKQIPILQEQGILDLETANLRSYKLRTEITTIENQIAQLPPANLGKIAETVSLPQFWLDLSEAERRFYFREFIRQIEIARDKSNLWYLKIIFVF